MLPAAGQGALGIEVRSQRQDVIDALAPLAHQKSWLAVSAERAVSRAMGGSCSMPLAAFATLDADTLTLDAAWGDPDGALPLVTARASEPVSDLASATALGERLASRLRARVLSSGGTLHPTGANPLAS
jgi:hydroxymethylbilane synthase